MARNRSRQSDQIADTQDVNEPVAEGQPAVDSADTPDVPAAVSVPAISGRARRYIASFVSLRGADPSVADAAIAALDRGDDPMVYDSPFSIGKAGGRPIGSLRSILSSQGL